MCLSRGPTQAQGKGWYRNDDSLYHHEAFHDRQSSFRYRLTLTIHSRHALKGCNVDTKCRTFARAEEARRAGIQCSRYRDRYCCFQVASLRTKQVHASQGGKFSFRPVGYSHNNKCLLHTPSARPGRSIAALKPVACPCFPAICPSLRLFICHTGINGNFFALFPTGRLKAR